MGCDVTRMERPIVRWLSRQASLDEALHEPLFNRHLLPPFFDNLTRSTLPTSSLSPPLQSPSTLLTPSPSSLDTLRSLSHRNHARSIATSPPTIATSWWWSQSQNVDSLLNEDDRADSPHQQQDNIRKKCSLFFVVPFSCHSLLIQV